MDHYLLSTNDSLKKLDSSKEGLKETEVQHRLDKYGKNVIVIQHPVSFVRLLLAQFKNYLVWLLIFIASFAFFTAYLTSRHQQYIDATIISIIVIVNAVIGAYQDYKSEKTAHLLKNMLKNNALVIRAGKKSEISSEELVPGDIIILSEGDKVPADCRIIESNEFRVDESMLTGESKTVHKKAIILKSELPLADRKNMVYMNTYVSGGQATGLVTATGVHTEIGKIAKTLEIKRESPFTKEVDRASKKITYVAMMLIISVLLIYSFKESDWISILMIGSALVIGSIPEGLPAIVTFSLAMGSLKLAKNKVLVKHKSLLETLGGVDVICTDKTGTLTENHMVVKKLFLDGKEVKNPQTKSSSFEHLKNCALLANEAKETIKGFAGGPEDLALVDYFNNFGIDIIQLREQIPQIDFQPFSSEKRYARSINSLDKKNVEFTKGAAEIILSMCDHIIIGNKVRKICEEDKKKIHLGIKSFSEKALRSIAFSYKVKKGKSSATVFVGFVGMYDPPKKDVKKTIDTIYEAGIDLKMITGDNVHTATAIAKECGFRNVKAVSWEELKDYSVDALKKAVEECNVFARMSPDFKLKIVAALQENGKRVAITGDGVNDVPALKKAEVGIAMGDRGTDIAKEAADLILLDDNLSSIVAGIKEGRTIFSNVRKVINYLLTANLAEVMVVFLGAMIGVMPFLAIQLLWVNFVTDIAPAMALGYDPSHKNIMKKKPTGKGEKLINKRITILTVYIGLKKFAIMSLIFIITVKLTQNIILAQTMSFTWLVMSHFVRLAAIRFDEGVNFFVNKYVNWSIFIPLLMQIIIIYTPLSAFFHVVPLSLREWSVLMLSFAVAVGLAKFITTMIDRNLPASETDY